MVWASAYTLAEAIRWSETSPGAPPPTRLGLPWPHFGDEATYAFRLEDRKGERLLLDEPEFLQVRWLEARDFVDGGGGAHRVNVLQWQGRWISSVKDGVPQSVTDHCCWDGWREAYFDARTDELVGQRQHLASHDSYTSPEDGAAVSRRSWSNRTTFGPPDHFQLGPRWSAVGCLGPVPLHRGPMPLAGPVRLWDTCEWGSRFFENASFLPERSETVGERTCVRFRASEPVKEAVARIWLCEGSPHPARVEVEYTAYEDLHAVYALVRESRGSLPLERDGPVAKPLPPPPRAPSRPWGHDETGVQHPFPLSLAYRMALANQTVRSLAGSENVTLISASLHERAWKGQLVQVWLVGLHAGESLLYLHVARPLDGLSEPWILELWRPDVEPGARPEMASELVPVAELFARVKALLRFSHPDLEPNYWQYGGEVGFQESELGDAPPENRTLSTWSVKLRLDGSGHTEALWEQHEVEMTGPPDPDFVPDPDAEFPPATAVTTFQDPGWRLSRRVVGSGLFALAAGLLVYAWPTLQKATGIALFSRLRQPRALDHATRAQLHTLVTTEPGIHLREIVRRTGIPRSSAEHHLRKLVELDLLSERSSSGYRCYFPPHTIDARLQPGLALLKNGRVAALLRFVEARPGATAAEAARAARLHRATVSRHLRRLEEAGLLTIERRGRHAVLAATPLASASLRYAT